jgi:hypothetical protein
MVVNQKSHLEMKLVIHDLRQIISEYSAKISAIHESDFSAKPLPTKWSKKEVLGHLIDSGQNNLRRFICGQYDAVPSKITYNQDFWVLANGYQSMKKDDVINLWKLVNERIAAILENMPEENYHKQSETSQLHTLLWLAEDYVRHTKHHLNQILAGSFDIVYK